MGRGVGGGGGRGGPRRGTVPPPPPPPIFAKDNSNFHVPTPTAWLYSLIAEKWGKYQLYSFRRIAKSSNF